MNVIAIYHHPQECGKPYVAFISQETGEMIETVDIPTGFYDSGMIRTDIYTPVYSFTEKINQSPMPTVDNVRLSSIYLPNPKHYTFRVTKVDNIKEDNTVFKTWTADVHVEACTHEISKDTFLHQMTKSGFDLSDWDIDKRMKTSFQVFLKDVCSKYKDYHLINLIEIG